MAKLSEEAKKLIGEITPGMIATASKDGKPNVAAKGSFRVVDDEHVIFLEMGRLHTLANLKENPQISALVLDAATRKGCRIWGKAEILESGDLLDAMAAELASRGVKVERIVKVKVEEVVTF